MALIPASRRNESLRCVPASWGQAETHTLSSTYGLSTGLTSRLPGGRSCDTPSIGRLRRPRYLSPP